MKHFSSTLFVCLFAACTFGQQAQRQNAPASPPRGLSVNVFANRDISERRLSPVAPHAAPRQLNAHTTTQSAYQGGWSSAVTYSQSQSVLFSGAIYFSLIDNNVGNNPTTSPTAWSFLAPGGTQSPCGAATIYGPCVLTVNDLPSIPASQITGLSTVANSGSYTDLTNRPTLGTAASQNVSAFDPAGAAAAITLSGLGGVTATQAAAAAPVQSVAGRAGAITLTAGDISGLGTAAMQSTSAFDAAGAANTAQAASLQKSSNLSDLSNAATARTNLGLGSSATQPSTAFDPAGAAAAITLAGLGGVTATQAAAAAPVQGIKVNNGATQTGTISLTIPAAQVAANLASSGTTGVTGTLPIANGGTGGISQQAAINALTGTQSAGKYLRSDGTNATLSSIQASDIPVLNQNTTGTASNVTGTVAIANGGTGGISQQAAINALTGTQSAGKYLRSDGTNATLSSIQASDIPVLNQNTTGTASNVTGTVAIANGGTGAATAAAALAGLGGVTAAQAAAAAPVQSVAGRTGIISLSTSDITGLGSAATQSTTAFDAAGAASSVQAASLQKSSNLSDLTNAVTARTNLGLGTAATQNTSAFDPAGAAAAITLSSLGGVTSAQAAAAAPIQSVAGRTGAITLTNTDISGLGTAATQNANAFSMQGGKISNTFCVGTGGVSANHLIQWDSNGCAIPATAGTFKGVALATVASGGSVEVARLGIVGCYFTTASTMNNLAIQSSTDPTSCADSGQTSESNIPNTTFVVGGIHSAVAAGNIANVRWHGIDVAGTQQAFSTLSGQPTDNANLSSVLGKKQSSIIINVLDYGLVADGATDNTAAWNTLMASTAVQNGGVSIFFPCNGTNNIYKFSGQMIFKSNATYYTDGGNNSAGYCRITSQYSGHDAAFLFVGADHVKISGLYLSSNNSSSPPYTVATFGWCYPGQNYAVYGSSTGPTTACNGVGKGSHYYLENVKFGGYASKAIVYDVGSEEWTAIDTYIYNMGGGAAYSYYTAQYDDLTACAECTFNSDTDIRFIGSHFQDQTGVATNSIIGLGRGNTGDITFDQGYMVNVSGGNCITMLYPNQTPITISNNRCENSNVFFNDPGGTSLYGVTLFGNTLASTVATNFISVAAGGTLTGFSSFGNNSSTAPTISIASGLTNSRIDEPTMSATLPTTVVNSTIRTNSGYVAHGPVNLGPDGLSPTCSSSTRGLVYVNQSGTPDLGQICMRTVAGSYAWVNFGSIPGTTASWNNSGSAIPANSCVNGPTVSINGVTTGMQIGVTPAANPGLGLDWNNAYVSSGTTVQVVICNKTASAITPVATTYNVRVNE